MMSRLIEIIAEAGICHNGDMYRATQMVHTAKECGADTVKFQVYNPRELLDKNDPLLSPWWDTIIATELTFAMVKYLKNLCDRQEIGFLASAFDVERVGWLEKLGVERYKIAARSIYDLPLAKAIAKTGKPVLVSQSDLYYRGGITAIVQVNCRLPIYWLYCVSEYPTPLSHLEWGHWTDDYQGFSDHTQGIAASVMAMSRGIQIIEKHFTLDKSLPGPDHICSADPDELYRLCQMRDDIEEILYADQVL